MIFVLGILVSLIVVFLPLEIIWPVIIFCFGLWVCVFLRPKEDYKFLFILFMLAFLSRVISSLLLYHWVFLNNGTGLLGDTWSFSESGYSILQLWLNGIRDVNEITAKVMEHSTSGNLGSYDFWNAVIYYFTGKSPITLIFINCLAGSSTVILTFYITKQIYNERAAKISAILTAFWPSLFMWSIQNLKEPLSIFLIVGLVLLILRLGIKFRFYLLFLILLLSLALKEFRLVSFSLFYGIVFPAYFILYLWKRKKYLIAVLLLLSSVFVIVFIKNHLNNTSVLEYMYKMRMDRATGNTAFLTDIDIRNPLNFVFFMPFALLIAWLAPFPWQLGSMSQISVMPEMLLYYLLLPAMFIGCKFILKHKIGEGGIIIAYIFIMVIILAFIEGNIGTLFRHRAMVLPFMFVLMSIGLDKLRFKITTSRS